jgi:hypothetical protein
MREIEIDIGAGLDADEIKEAMYPATYDDPDATCLLHEVAYALVFADGSDNDEIFEIDIDDVSIDEAYPNQVDFEFTVSWGHHSPCKDMRKSGNDQYSTTATYTAEGLLIFLVPAQRRFSNPC